MVTLLGLQVGEGFVAVLNYSLGVLMTWCLFRCEKLTCLW